MRIVFTYFFFVLIHANRSITKEASSTELTKMRMYLTLSKHTGDLISFLNASIIAVKKEKAHVVS